MQIFFISVCVGSETIAGTNAFFCYNGGTVIVVLNKGYCFCQSGWAQPTCKDREYTKTRGTDSLQNAFTFRWKANCLILK